jgi:hypothetical protein
MIAQRPDESWFLHRIVDRTDKTVTASRKSFDITRSPSFVSQGFAEALHRVVDTLIEFNESIGRPQALLKFFPCDELARFFEEH